MGKAISKLNFCSVFRNAWLSAVTPANICGGFKKVGVFPFNRDAVSLPENSSVYSGGGDNGDSDHTDGGSNHTDGDGDHADGDSDHADGDSDHADGDGDHADGGSRDGKHMSRTYMQSLLSIAISL